MFGKIIDTIYLIGDGFEGDWYTVRCPCSAGEEGVFREITCTARAPVMGPGRNSSLEKTDRITYIWERIC